MKRIDKKFLIACTLGDGCINKRYIYNKFESYRFLMKHSEKQKDYFMWKAERLEEILCAKKPRTKIFSIYKNSGRSKINAYQYDKASITKLKPIYNLIYVNNKKTFSKKVLNQLNEEGLAIWFMDDGFTNHKKNKDKGIYSSCTITLNTYLSYEENVVIQKYFNAKWDIQWNINKDTTDTGKVFYRLSAGTQQARKLFDIIAPYIHPSMTYKITMKIGNTIEEHETPENKFVSLEESKFILKHCYNIET